MVNHSTIFLQNTWQFRDNKKTNLWRAMIIYVLRRYDVYFRNEKSEYGGRKVGVNKARKTYKGNEMKGKKIHIKGDC